MNHTWNSSRAPTESPSPTQPGYTSRPSSSGHVDQKWSNSGPATIPGVHVRLSGEDIHVAGADDSPGHSRASLRRTWVADRWTEPDRAVGAVLPSGCRRLLPLGGLDVGRRRHRRLSRTADLVRRSSTGGPTSIGAHPVAGGRCGHPHASAGHVSPEALVPVKGTGPVL